MMQFVHLTILDLPPSRSTTLYYRKRKENEEPDRLILGKQQMTGGWRQKIGNNRQSIISLNRVFLILRTNLSGTSLQVCTNLSTVGPGSRDLPVEVGTLEQTLLRFFCFGERRIENRITNNYFVITGGVDITDNGTLPSKLKLHLQQVG